MYYSQPIMDIDPQRESVVTSHESIGWLRRNRGLQVASFRTDDRLKIETKDGRATFVNEMTVSTGKSDPQRVSWNLEIGHVKECMFRKVSLSHPRWYRLHNKSAQGQFFGMVRVYSLCIYSS